MNQYYLRHIYLLPAFKFGALAGGLLLFLPGLLLGLLIRAGVGALRDWLEGWQTWSIELPLVEPIEVDLLALLNLTDFFQTMQTLDDNGWLLIITFTLAAVLGGGVAVGLLVLAGAAIYNLLAQMGGGLVVEAEVVGGVTLPGQAGLPPLPRPAPVLPAQPIVAAAWLVSKQNPQQYWPLRAGVTAVGSSPDNHIVLPGLHPHHAEIRLEGQRFILYNRSGGPVMVNNYAVSEANLLKDGFTIRLADSEFIFRS